MTTAAPFALGAVAPPCPGAHAPALIRDRPFRAVANIVACSPSTIAPDTLRIELRATIVTPTLDARNLYFVAGVCRRDAFPEHLRELVAESLRD